MALQDSLEPTEEVEVKSFHFAFELLEEAAQILDLSDDQQKRRILQDLIKRIVLIDDKVQIEWNF